MVAVLVPQLRDAFDATTAGVAATLPAYLIPFAAFQLVSGTIGERIGRRKVVRTAFLAYALLSLAAAFAPSLETFIVIRALQGTANAFLTPLLLAGLADLVPPGQLGRAVGTFAAVQTAAIALAPLGGGALGAVDWRLAFLSQVVVALGLALFPPHDAERRDTPPRLRAVFTRRVGLLSGAAFTGYAGVTGIGFLVAVEAADEFGLGSILRGVLLAGLRRRRDAARPGGGRRRGPVRPHAGHLRRHRDLLRAGRRARLRALSARAGRAVVRDRARLRADVGGHQRARRWRPCRATGRAGRRSSAPSNSRATRSLR